MYIKMSVLINVKLPCPSDFFFETQEEFVVSRDVNMTILISLYTPLQSKLTFIRPDLTYLIIRVNIVILGVPNFCMYVPFEKGGAYCFAYVGRYVGVSLNLVQLIKTNHPISSNSHPSATANKAIHSLKIGGGGYKTNGNII